MRDDVHHLSRRVSIAVVIVVAAAAIAFAFRSWRARDPIRALIAASRTHRVIEARLSGFPWAAPVHASRGERDASSAGESIALLAAAAEIAQRKQHDGSAAVLHAAALSNLLLGDRGSAASELEMLVKSDSSAATWNDLAATFYSVATRDDDPVKLTRALAAADAALRAQPSSAEARFNRALIIEALGLRDLAREEWEAFLKVDSSSGWASEAREHLRSLAPEEDFLVVLAREYDHLAADPEAAHRFARRFRQRSRTWGEAEIVGSWAKAFLQHDDAQAAKHLAVAREFGAELARDGGNETLAAIVATIDHADDALRASLADAHNDFCDALRAYRDRKVGDAQRLLISAREKFARAGSPAELRAHYYYANTLFDQGKLDDSAREQQQVAASTPPRFTAQRAEVLWGLGSVAFAQGRLGACIDRWTEAVALFERLGEMNYAAILRGQLAYTFDLLGNPGRSWKGRIETLRELGRQLTSRQIEALTEITRAAVLNEDWPVALSFLQLEIDVGRRLPRPMILIETLLYRAKVLASTGDRAAALADLSEARGMIAKVDDVAFRSSLDATAKSVEATVTTDPRNAINLLTSAIEYQSTKGRRVYLPQLYENRGRAYRTIADGDHAAADFESAVSELEQYRATLRAGEDRWGVFGSADELFGEAVSLALERHDSQRAFDYVERARARSLLDALHFPWQQVTPKDVASDTALIEYAIFPKAAYTFVIDDAGIHASEQTIDRARLDSDIKTFTRDHGAATARSLYKTLIAPVESRIAGKRTLTIVPDPQLHNVPFGALIDGRGRYVVETYAIETEPSAAIYARLRAPLASPQPPHALIVQGGEDLGMLSAAQHETDTVARLYRSSTLLRGETATSQAFVREAAAAGVIHFAGHAVASTGPSHQAFLLLAGKGDDARFDAEKIAALRLPSTSLVVLAACDTAAGEIRSTEGTISIARAFIASGVPSVIATLWPIEDEASAEFFPALHQRLVQGASPAEALRATQLEWIRRGNRAPTIWAAVQLVGK